MAEPGREIDSARRAVAAVFDGREADRIEVANGGISNRSFIVGVGGRQYMLRLQDRGSQALLNLAEEYALLETVAAAGLGPRPVGFDAARGALVVDYVDGALPWDLASAARPPNIRRIAKLLRRLHALEASVAEFTPGRYAEAYFEALGGRVALGGDEGRLAAELMELAEECRSLLAGTAICHNDLVAANILEGPGLMLVDFEYAAGAAPVLDLASLAVMNSYGGGACAMLIETYHAPHGAPFSVPEFAKVSRLVRLLGHFWARAASARGEDHRSVAQFLDCEAR